MVLHQSSLGNGAETVSFTQVKCSRTPLLAF